MDEIQSFEYKKEYDKLLNKINTFEKQLQHHDKCIYSIKNEIRLNIGLTFLILSAILIM